MSEHFTYCTDEVVPYLLDIVNETFSMRQVPDMKEGILTPVQKGWYIQPLQLPRDLCNPYPTEDYRTCTEYKA